MWNGRFVLSVNVQMKVIKNGIQAHFREKVRWGVMRWGYEEDRQKLNPVVLLKGQWSQSRQFLQTELRKGKPRSVYPHIKMVSWSAQSQEIPWRALWWTEIVNGSHLAPTAPRMVHHWPHSWVRTKEVLNKSIFIWCWLFIWPDILLSKN